MAFIVRFHKKPAVRSEITTGKPAGMKPQALFLFCKVKSPKMSVEISVLQNHAMKV